MSVRINDKIIAGTYTPQSYRYVGEIFQSILPINDVRVALLDGHKIYDSDGHGGFIQYLNSLVTLYPQLACTEDEWQLSSTTYGECGKFVINEDGSIRLPKIVSFIQGLSSLQDLATLVEAGLPNIDGEVTASASGSFGNINVSGAFIRGTQNTTTSVGVTGNGGYNLGFDASISNPIYGNSSTVQPQSIRYPYYIVLATGVSQELRVKQNLTTNNPFFLGMSQYFETAPNNNSWLKSEGQWNSKAVYPTVYDWALINANNNIEGFKLITDTYTDFDFVLNTTDETFRLPLLNGSETLPSDKYIDLVLGESGDSYEAPANGWFVLNAGGTSIRMNTKTSPDSTPSWLFGQLDKFQGTLECKKGGKATVLFSTVTSTNTFRFIYATGNGSLYFYVGETVQNANLINAGRIEETMATKKMVDGQWVSKSFTVTESITASMDKTFDISSYLPVDGYNYEVIISGYGNTGATSGNSLVVSVSTDIIQTGQYIICCRTRTTSAVNAGSTMILPVGTARTLRVRNGDTAATSGNITLRGYRRIGTNV